MTACEKMGQTRFGARALPAGGGGWWGGGRSTSSLCFILSVPHQSCTPFSCAFTSPVSARQSL